MHDAKFYKTMVRKLLFLIIFTSGLGGITSLLYATPQAAYYHYLQALLFARSGAFKQAIQEYQQVLSLDPAASEVYRDLIDVYMEISEQEEALKLLEQLEKIEPQDERIYILRGKILWEKGEIAPARSALEQALKENPENTDTLFLLANLTLSTKDFVAARGYLERYQRLNPEFAEIDYRLGLISLEEKKPADAENYFREALRKAPDSFPAHLNLAELYELRGSTAAAVKEYQECLRIQPQSANVLLHLGMLYYQFGEKDKAWSLFQQYRFRQPNDQIIQGLLLELAQEREDWGAAQKLAESMYKRNKEPVYLLRSGYFAFKRGDLTTAANNLSRAQPFFPEDKQLLLLLVLAERQLGKPRVAEKILRQALRRDPQNSQFLFHYGALAEEKGNRQRALEIMEQVLLLEPGNSAAANFLAYLLAEENQDLAKADELIEQALKEEPENPAYLDTRGWIYYRQGELAKAAEYLERARNLFPDPEIGLHQAILARAEDKPDKAWLIAQKELLSLPSSTPPRIKKSLRKTVQELEKEFTQGPPLFLQQLQFRLWQSRLPELAISGNLVFRNGGLKRKISVPFLLTSRRNNGLKLEILGNFVLPRLILEYPQPVPGQTVAGTVTLHGLPEFLPALADYTAELEQMFIFVNHFFQGEIPDSLARADREPFDGIENIKFNRRGYLVRVNLKGSIFVTAGNYRPIPRPDGGRRSVFPRQMSFAVTGKGRINLYFETIKPLVP